MLSEHLLTNNLNKEKLDENGNNSGTIGESGLRLNTKNQNMICILCA